jgi:hypothetical protein
MRIFFAFLKSLKKGLVSGVGFGAGSGSPKPGSGSPRAGSAPKCHGSPTLLYSHSYPSLKRREMLECV